MRNVKMASFLIVCLFFGTAGLAQAQTMAFTNGPNATTPTGVNFDCKWDNCTGIASVAALVTKGKTVLANPNFATNVASASKVNWTILLSGSKAGNVVSVTVYAADVNGVVLAQAAAVQVTLK